MSNLLRRAALLAAVVALGFASCVAPLAAQPAISPEIFSNRRLGHLNDASAVGWNPALLGLRSGETDLLAAGSYDRDLDLTRMLYALFAKVGPVGLGSTGPLGDSAGAFADRLYHGGLGAAVLDEEFWGGLGVRWTDGKGFIPSVEFLLSGVYRVRPDLLTGLTLGNLTGNNDASQWVDAQAAFAATSWLTLFGSLRIDERDTLGGRSLISPALGVSLGLGNNTLMLSGSYDLNRSLGRFGIEAMLGNVVFGSINGLDDGGSFAGGVALVRWSSTMEQSVGDALPLDPEDVPMGWAPDRAYVPSGLEYTQPASNNDAMRNQQAIEMPCTGASGVRFDAPAGLTAIVTGGAPVYAPLAARLREISPNPNELFSEIRRRFYSPPVRNRELSSGDTLSLLSRDGHAISVQSVDASGFPLVSVIMRVTDATGRTVSGLGPRDFAFRDTTTRIVSVQPTDSSFNVPVDIVVIVDCSGSMSDEIESVRRNIERFADNLEARGIDYRIGGVLYGSVIYDTLHPTANIRRYREFIARAAPIGGDEITTLALKAATEMDFRSGAQRVFVMITDDWAVQNNSTLDESQLTQMLWDTHARLYSIITPCKNNGAVMTRLALGREFDIRAPFTSILDEIGSDLTTTYELVYESQARKEVVVPKVTILRGRVRDESGAPVPTTIELDAPTGRTLRLPTNGTTGEYETEIAEGIAYTARLGGERYLPLVEEVDLTMTRTGDTITRDFRLRIRNTTVIGHVTDEHGAPVDGQVRIEDAVTLERIDTVVATNGLYEVVLEEGRIYRLTPTAKNYIPFPEEVDARVERGTELKRDLRVMSIDAAIASGAVFRLKNIFFDYDRSDLRAESSEELDRLVALLEEYPIIRVEIGAHTDSKGSDTYNMTLSSRRAQSVRDYLVAQGIAEGRLTSRGYGESAPVGTNDTDEGRAMNRRVEFRLLK